MLYSVYTGALFNKRYAYAIYSMQMGYSSWVGEDSENSRCPYPSANLAAKYLKNLSCNLPFEYSPWMHGRPAVSVSAVVVT